MPHLPVRVIDVAIITQQRMGEWLRDDCYGLQYCSRVDDLEEGIPESTDATVVRSFLPAEKGLTGIVPLGFRKNNEPSN